MSKLIDKLKENRLNPIVVDDLVREWHENEAITESLKDFLGLSRDEYDRFVKMGDEDFVRYLKNKEVL